MVIGINDILLFQDEMSDVVKERGVKRKMREEDEQKKEAETEEDEQKKEAETEEVEESILRQMRKLISEKFSRERTPLQELKIHQREVMKIMKKKHETDKDKVKCADKVECAALYKQYDDDLATLVRQYTRETKNRMSAVKFGDDLEKYTAHLEPALMAEVKHLQARQNRKLKTLRDQHKVKLEQIQQEHKKSLLKLLERKQSMKPSEIARRVKESFSQGERLKELSLPECPVCYNFMSPEVGIVTCVKGHLVCLTCTKDLTSLSCPTCRGKLAGRASDMEELLSLYKIQ